MLYFFKRITSVYRERKLDRNSLSWKIVICKFNLKEAVLCDGKLIGIARALSDGVSDAYIQDVTVSEDFRGRGIGGRLVTVLSEELSSRGIDWIGLVGVPGTEHFYSSLGFEAQGGHTLWLRRK